MARHTDEIDDPTPLAGARIDVAARIGWLLRASRVAAGVPLRELAARAGAGSHLSPATLSRVETTGRRGGAVVAAYERALGLPPGHLRVPVDVLCRTFSYAPADTDPYLPEPTLAGFTAAVDAVASPSPSAQDWLRFAEYHVLSPFGMPAHTIRPLLARLADEVGRAAGLAYQLRYEALSKLRCSAYADVVDEVVRAAVTEPGMQRPADLLSAVTENPTPDLVGWCGELLGHESWVVARAACLGIQNMRSVGGLRRSDWLPLVPVFADACDAAAGDPLRQPILSATLACCPAEFRTAVRDRLSGTLVAPRRAAAWTRTRRNRHFAHAAGLAARITGTSAGETMLARLLFEVLYDFRATHVVTSSFLLVASPFADGVREQMVRSALDGPDETTRHGAAFAFANLMIPFDSADPAPWLASADPVLRGAGLAICGFAGRPLAPDLLRELVAHDDQVGHDAMFAAGMAQQPELAELATAPHLPPAVRAGAAWWRAAGGRIVD
ncbi:helix-turn-helix domain-containing protein [Nocardioides daeguensis]|uniref:HTH cro/C1-type domain-containing protein n=1 Tax=Nocardioides daeguensis TaxID=908359 RepID=A0ABP6V7E2_9ACTN|nr:helix-turn-helix transcriptional regulator [Nocardioides daeguensis]MBV6726308.1 helix-turn-helix transcriptional regulator [Nocardioides daeguensis]MCR1772151.1 helix-turn-helix transcriptional regulator [Nocardioides daeguensis]